MFSNQIKNYFFISAILIFTIFNLQLAAQPSGGPYGPVQQNYELPKVSGKIYFVSPDGRADQFGESVSNPTTIEAAIERVKTGDAIVLRGGTYRTGNLLLNQGITVQPYADEQPIFKGTYVAENWQNLRNGLWTTSWSHFFPSKPDTWWRRHREGKKTPLYRFNNDMVFVNGKFLQAVGWEGEVDENTYYIDYDTELVYIGVDPTDKLIEITAFDAAIIRTTKDVHGKTSDKKGPIIRGVTFTQYAFRALEIEGYYPERLSNEANHGKDVVGTTLENCTISFCSRVAGYFIGDKLTIRNCKVSDTSTEGIYIIASSDVLLEKNIFTRNNIERITGYYPAAVKIFNQSYRVICNDNLVIDLPYSNGIWYDVGNVDGVFINNWIEGVGNNITPLNVEQPYPSDNGFFFEISKGAVCAGNVFVNCDHGIWVLNSSNVKIFNNTFVNSTACIARNARSAQGDHFGWHPSTGPNVDERYGHEFVNNLMVGINDFKRPLLYVWQPDSICNKITGPQLHKLDNNVYVRSSDKSNMPLILWSPAKNKNKCMTTYESPANLHKDYPEFSSSSKFLNNYHGSLFKSYELGDYHLLSSFPESKSGTSLPSNIQKLVNQKGNYIGAYPPID